MRRRHGTYTDKLAVWSNLRLKTFGGNYGPVDNIFEGQESVEEQDDCHILGEDGVDTSTLLLGRLVFNISRETLEIIRSKIALCCIEVKAPLETTQLYHGASSPATTDSKHWELPRLHIFQYIQ